MSAETRRRSTLAAALGAQLADLVAQPTAFAAAADAGLRALATAADAAELRRVAPTLANVAGTSFFTVERVGRALNRLTRADSPANLLLCAQALYGLPYAEGRWLAFVVLDRLVTVEPERTWQLLRRASKEATEWITVDALAHPVGRGILAEAFRWAELGQLVFAPSPWERRLVGSTIATIPYVDRDAGRRSDVAAQALPLVGALIGDDRPEVQKALAWALRSLVLVDLDAVATFCEREAARAADTDDGHRAWVLRDVLPKLAPSTAATIRSALAGIRRRANAASTSDASAIATAFVETGGVPPLGGPHVERIPVGAR